MSKKKTISKDFRKIVTGTLIFSFVFLGSCFLISAKFPVEDFSLEDSKTAELQPLQEEGNPSESELSLAKEYNEQKIAEAMQTAVIKHSEQSDTGLEYYRNPNYRAGVVWFYTQITGNCPIAESILYFADENDIPLSLAFALAWSESRYNSNAVNKNSNSSIDRGLFQLNSNSFPELEEADFFDPYTSAKYGLSHLRFCLDTAGNEVAALAMYNAGTTRVRKNGTPQVTLNYVSSIINYEQGLEELFGKQIAKWNETDGDLMLASLHR